MNSSLFSSDQLFPSVVLYSIHRIHQLLALAEVLGRMYSQSRRDADIVSNSYTQTYFAETTAIDSRLLYR